MYITQFGGYVLPTQYDMFETQGASKRIDTQDLAGMGGSLRLGGAATSPYEQDTITKRFFIQAANRTALESAIDSMVNELMMSQADRRQGEQLLIAELADGSQRCTIAECKEARWTMEYFNLNNGWVGPVDVTWQRSVSRWWTFDDAMRLGDHWTFADLETGGDLDGTTYGQNVEEQTLSGATETFTITNAGKQPVIDGIIEFDGAITNPTVLNNRNKYQFTLTAALTGAAGTGERATINIANFMTKINGVPQAQSVLTIGTARGQLMPMALEPGDNEIVITSTGPNCKFRFYYARTWL